MRFTRIRVDPVMPCLNTGGPIHARILPAHLSPAEERLAGFAVAFPLAKGTRSGFPQPPGRQRTGKPASRGTVRPRRSARQTGARAGPCRWTDDSARSPPASPVRLVCYARRKRRPRKPVRRRSINSRLFWPIMTP